MTISKELFQIHILDRDGNVIDTDDCVMTSSEIDWFLNYSNAVEVRLGEPRFDAWEIDMADMSRGYVRVVGVAQ